MSEGNKQSKTWFIALLAAFYLFIFAILLSNSFGYLDPDFGWHLKTGEEIWQTRAVPDMNYNDYTLAGTHWVDHEWLSNLFIYAVYHNFGYIALSVFFAMLALAILIIQLQFTRKYFLQNDRGLIFVLLLQGFGLYASLPHLGVRVQEISLLNTLLLIIVIFHYERWKNVRVLWWLLPLFIFWASAHGGFLLGLFLLGWFVFIKLIERLAVKNKLSYYFGRNNILSFQQIGAFAVVSFLAFAITWLTPYGARLYSFLASYGNSYYLTRISEWLPEYYYPFACYQLAYLEIVLIFLVLFFFPIFIFKNKDKKKISFWHVSLIFLFFCLSFEVRRNLPLLFVVSLPILAEFFVDFFKTDFNFKQSPRFKSLILHKTTRLFLFSALVLCSAYVFTQTRFTSYPEKTYQDAYPWQAVNFLKAHPEWNKLKIFNEYGWGGYLIWQYPSEKLFIDGRMPQHELKGHSLLEEYFAFFADKQAAEKLKEYDIGLVLLAVKSEKVNVSWWEKIFFGIKEQVLLAEAKNDLALHDYLKDSPDWLSVYSDNLAEVFVKKN